MGNLAICFIASLAVFNVFIRSVEGVDKGKGAEGPSQWQSSQPNTNLSLGLTNVDEVEAFVIQNEQNEQRLQEERKRRKEEKERERIEIRKERKVKLIQENKIKKNARRVEKKREKKAELKQGTSGEGSNVTATTGSIANLVAILAPANGSMENNVSIAAPATDSMGPPFSSLPPSYPVFSSWFSSSPSLSSSWFSSSPASSNFDGDAGNPPQTRNFQPTATGSMENLLLSSTVTPRGSGSIGNPVPDLAVATDSMGPPAPSFSSLPPSYPVFSSWLSSSSSLSSSWFFSSSAPSNFDGDAGNPPQPITTGSMGNPPASTAAATATESVTPPSDSHPDPLFSSDSFSSSSAPFNFDSRNPPQPTRAPDEATGYQNLGRDKYKMEDLPPKKRKAPEDE